MRCWCGLPSNAGWRIFSTSSWPGLSRPSTSLMQHGRKTWMPGTRPGTTSHMLTPLISALARCFEAPQQQGQHRVDPRPKLGIVPFLGMGRMMEADGGFEQRARRDLGIGNLEDA